MAAAVRGLLLDLDPHSAYLDKEDAEAFDEETTAPTTASAWKCSSSPTAASG